MPTEDLFRPIKGPNQTAALQVINGQGPLPEIGVALAEIGVALFKWRCTCTPKSRYTNLYRSPLLFLRRPSAVQFMALTSIDMPGFFEADASGQGPH